MFPILHWEPKEPNRIRHTGFGQAQESAGKATLAKEKAKEQVDVLLQFDWLGLYALKNMH